MYTTDEIKKLIAKHGIHEDHLFDVLGRVWARETSLGYLYNKHDIDRTIQTILNKDQEWN